MTPPEVRKAALVLMSLPPAAAAAMLAKLEPRQLQSVALEIAADHRYGRSERDAVIRQWMDLCHTASLQHPSSAEPIQSARRFAALERSPAEVWQTLLVDELPQTIALVLAQLSPQSAQAVLATLPPATAAEIERRRTELEPVADWVLEDVMDCLIARDVNLAPPPASAEGRVVPTSWGYQPRDGVAAN